MYNAIKNKVETACAKAYNLNFQNVLKKLKPNEFNNRKLWSIAKILKGKRSILPFFRSNNKILVTDQERAEELANRFQQNHEVTANNRVPRNLKTRVEECIQSLRNNTGD